MKKMQVNALLSDYDGTLCPTSSVRGDINVSNTLPEELEQALVHISERIPVCIVSSKDFTFLHEKVRFANILSCVLGIETVIHNPHNSDNFDCVRYQHLTANRRSLKDNSKMLHNVVKILQNQNDIMIEEKYDSAKEILIGLTVDYRHLQNWQFFKENKEPMLREMIERSINTNLATNLTHKDRPFIQKYSSHPFLDVYGVECNKGLAFDSVLLQLNQEERANIIYLGDSENDNPAFKKSDISIGIRSDRRLNPMLDCKYMLDFSQLPLFLRGLMDNDFIFSEDILPDQVD
jgi:HAD superfamily hydrolase (TIGR01484 family)